MSEIIGEKAGMTMNTTDKWRVIKNHCKSLCNALENLEPDKFLDAETTKIES